MQRGRVIFRSGTPQATTDPHGRHTYRLKFADAGTRGAREIEFEAEDAYQALLFAHDEANSRSAELWRDGRKLCSIKRTVGDV